MLITIVLVIFVIFLFLGDVSSTVIASLALPISVLGSFAAMKAFGFTLNNISLMALTLSVGFVIDDAIVVLENIVRHMELGQPRRLAALKGAQEIGFTIVSMTVSLVAVFIPILLMGGLIGPTVLPIWRHYKRLYFDFGFCLSFSDANAVQSIPAAWRAQQSKRHPKGIGFGAGKSSLCLCWNLACSARSQTVCGADVRYDGWLDGLFALYYAQGLHAQ